jgi:hypothetical protein
MVPRVRAAESLVPGLGGTGNRPAQGERATNARANHRTRSLPPRSVGPAVRQGWVMSASSRTVVGYASLGAM